jgi:hypothetical protein
MCVDLLAVENNPARKIDGGSPPAPDGDAQALPHHGEEAVPPDRFVYQTIASRRDAIGVFMVRGTGADNDDRNRSSSEILLEQPADVFPVHVRHVKLEENEVRRNRSGFFEGFRSRPRPVDLESGLPQAGDLQLNKKSHIIDDQQPFSIPPQVKVAHYATGHYLR